MNKPDCKKLISYWYKKGDVQIHEGIVYFSTYFFSTYSDYSIFVFGDTYYDVYIVDENSSPSAEYHARMDTKTVLDNWGLYGT
jgi:hypothetical protein